MTGRRSFAGRLLHLWPYALIVGVYLLLAYFLRLHRPGPDWEGFLTLVDQTLQGDPLHIYAYRFWRFHSFANGPVAIWVWAPFRLASNLLGLSDRLQRFTVMLPFLISDVLCGAMLLHVTRRAPGVTRAHRLFLFSLFLSSWIVFFSSAYHAHYESFFVLILLLAIVLIQRKRYVWGGITYGLALLTRQPAVLVIIPHLAVLLFSEGWRKSLTVGLIVSGVVLLVMLPYVLADPANVRHFAIELPRQRPVAYQSTWYLVERLPGALAFGQRYADLLILAISTAASLLFAWRLRIGPADGRLFGLAGFNALVMALLTKWGSLHYYLLPLALLLVWEVLSYTLPWATILFASTMSNVFVLWVSRETNLPFSFETALVMVVLLLAMLAYVGVKMARQGELPSSG